MSPQLMTLEVLLPAQIFCNEADVLRIVVHTRAGSFGLLPRRLDCVAALTPGLLTYETAAAEVNLAVDEGVLVKTGHKVLVSVRRAYRGTDLRQLRTSVEQEFLTLDEREQSVRAALARLEAGFITRIGALGHD